jgi:hypothetical protein
MCGATEVSRAADSQLSDLTGYWGESYIRALADQNIVAGFPDGTFKPNDQVTRAQFAAMVTRAFKLESESGGNNNRFSDVKDKYWGSGAIAAVSAAGLVSGFPDGTFHPEDKITRAQGLVILAKALPEKRDLNEALARYRDADSVPRWASDAMLHAATEGIIVSFPDPSAIQPNSLASRGELAAMTYETLAAKGEFPRLDIGALPLLRPAVRVKLPPKPQPQPVDVEIQSLDLLSAATLKAGQTLQVGLAGTPGCHAFFRISQIGETVEMTEKSPGNYAGSAQILAGEHAQNAIVHATLMRKTGEHAEKTSSWTLQLEGAGPTVVNLVPAPDSLVPSRTPAIKAVFQEPGGINLSSVKLMVDGRDVTAASTVTPNSITFRPAFPYPGSQVHVAVTVSDQSGNSTQQRWTFFLERPSHPYPMGWQPPPPMTPGQEIQQGVRREINSVLR